MIFPSVPLSKVTNPVARTVPVTPGLLYRTIGVKWWGEGAYERQTIDGSQTAAKSLSMVRAGDLIINKIWVRHGSVAVATSVVDGCAASGEFPTFIIDQDRVLPQWIHWQIQTRDFWHKCESLSRGTSGKNRIKPELFLKIEIPLPPLPEQRRIVARIESLAERIDETRRIREEVQDDLSRLLNTAYRQIADKAPRKPLGDLAPLDRRPVAVDFEASYPQVAVRSFGRGTFHKPPLIGSEVTWEKPFLVKAGDILVSNIKAWEGAIAVAGKDDDGRVGSHRYLTCVARPGVSTARFVCFHLLSPEGLYAVGEASPGSADRNRTLNSKAFMQIPVPVPEYGKQLWFDALCIKVEAIAQAQTDSLPELAALLPSILDKAFKGEL